MKFTKLAAAAALAIAAVPGAALAQDAAVDVTAGATVYGTDGAAIGTIKSTDASATVLDVDGMDATIPTGAIGQGDNGLKIEVTKAALVQMLQTQNQQAAAARDAALVVGADVKTANGMPVGAIKTVEGDTIVVNHGEGAVALTREQFAVANGELVALVAMADIMAAMEAQAGAMTEGGQ